MAGIMTRAGLALGRALLSLHYKVEVRNIEAVKGLKGGMICPDHVAYVDPPLLVTALAGHVVPRPVAYSGMYNVPFLKPLMQALRTLPIESTWDGASDWKRYKIRRSMDAIRTAVSQGDTLLIYPSGQLRGTATEQLGGKSSVHDLVKQFPGQPIVLARIRGLNGSVWSRYFTGGVRTPELKHILAILRRKPGLIFRRVPVTIELERFDQVADFATPRAMNEWLEAWYNKVPDPVMPGRAEAQVPGFTYSDRVSDHDDVPLDPDVSRKVIAYLAAEARLDPASVTPDKDLIRDLGLDSLVTSTLPMWIEETFQKQVDAEARIMLVRDVILGAQGVLGDVGGPRDISTPKGWLETRRPAPAYPRDAISVPHGFLLQRARMGGKAVCMGDDRSGVLTYDQVTERAIMLANVLKKLPEDRIGMMLPASVGGAVVSLAVMLTGKTVVPLNWTNGRAALDASIELAGVKTILTSDLFLDKANVELSEGTAARIVPLESMRSQIGLSGLLNGKRLARRSPDGILEYFGNVRSEGDVAVILFTSGSEAVPKGVPLTHGNILSNIDGSLEAIQGYPSDVMYGFLPPFHSFGMTIIVALSMVGGVKVAFDADPKKYRHLAHGVEKWKATLLAGTPDFLAGILNAGEPKNFMTIRAFLAGAQKTPPILRERVERLGAKLLEGYGITETAPLVSCNRPDEPPVGVGKPIKNTQVLIVDPATKRPREPGEEGLILVAGPGVFGGYLGNVTSPFVEVDGKRYYNTGDLGSFQGDNLVISGRLKRFLKFGGEMISLPAIEDALVARWPAGEAGPVVTVDGEEREGLAPIVCLYTTDRSIGSEEANRVLKGAGLPPLAYVRHVHHLPEIPLLGSGKTNYRALPRPSEIAVA
jgi:acyl-CoA synthetase (AMP-forming)/AMP-acid ligase II/1-acyl-sn-glycerol-3-phosphate acyltransferase/acyl carrier protein